MHGGRRLEYRSVTSKTVDVRRLIHKVSSSLKASISCYSFTYWFMYSNLFSFDIAYQIGRKMFCIAIKDVHFCNLCRNKPLPAVSGWLAVSCWGGTFTVHTDMPTPTIEMPWIAMCSSHTGTCDRLASIGSFCFCCCLCILQITRICLAARKLTLWSAGTGLGWLVLVFVAWGITVSN